MHGSIFYGFKQFVLTRHGSNTWDTVVRAAKVRGWYHPTNSYPDQELEALVTAVAASEGRNAGAVWEEFGEALVPNLVRVYGPYLLPTWRTLDLLEHVETVIHRTVRMQDKAATPPHLRPTRASATTVRIEYASHRRLCTLAVGICRGVAKHYGDAITIQHPQCMLLGDDRCLIVVETS